MPCQGSQPPALKMFPSMARLEAILRAEWQQSHSGTIQARAGQGESLT